MSGTWFKGRTTHALARLAQWLRDYGLSVVATLLVIAGAPLALDNWNALQSANDAQVPAPESAVTMLLVGVLATLLGVVLTVHDQRRTHSSLRALEERRSHSVTRFTDELGSTLDVLVESAVARRAGSAGTREHGSDDGLVKDVLREGRRLYAHDGVRLCFYMLDRTEQEAEEDRQWHLQLRAYDGRRDSPRFEFVHGAHAQSLIKIAQGNNAVAVVDPSSPPKGVVVDHSEHSGWKSYLAVPVMGERQNHGVLLIDTRHRVDFGDEDKSIGWTIARLLVHGLQLAERHALQTRPEVRSVIQRFIERHGATRVSELGERLRVSAEDEEVDGSPQDGGNDDEAKGADDGERA